MKMKLKIITNVLVVMILFWCYVVSFFCHWLCLWQFLLFIIITLWWQLQWWLHFFVNIQQEICNKKNGKNWKKKIINPKNTHFIMSFNTEFFEFDIHFIPDCEDICNTFGLLFLFGIIGFCLYFIGILLYIQPIFLPIVLFVSILFVLIEKYFTLYG